MTTYDKVHRGYEKMWASCTLNANKHSMVLATAQKIINNRVKYAAIEKATGVPWYMLGALHYRESDNNFNTYLGNGQSLSRVTTIVPKGRGPFIGPDAFIKGGIDAMNLMRFGKVPKDQWVIPRCLFEAEEFNGEGYTHHGENSPYVWGGTNFEQPGLFVGDHDFDESKRDTRIGVAAIFKGIIALAPALMLGTEATGTIVSEPQAPAAKPEPKPEIPMTTTKPVTTPANFLEAMPKINLSEIQSVVEKLVNLLPFAATFIPQIKVLIPFGPVLLNILKMVAELQQSTDHSPEAIANIIAGHMQTASNEVTDTKTAMAEIESQPQTA